MNPGSQRLHSRSLWGRAHRCLELPGVGRSHSHRSSAGENPLDSRSHEGTGKIQVWLRSGQGDSKTPQNIAHWGSESQPLWSKEGHRLCCRWRAWLHLRWKEGRSALAGWGWRPRATRGQGMRLWSWSLGLSETCVLSGLGVPLGSVLPFGYVLFPRPCHPLPFPSPCAGPLWAQDTLCR